MQMLNAAFDMDDTTGMTVKFSCPPTKLATGQPAMILDFGDGTPTWTADSTGMIKHTYAAPGGGTAPHPWVFSAVLRDADNAVRGGLRFELPRGQYRPWDIAASAF